MRIGGHMCPGHAHGKWMAAGGYERIAEQSFSSLNVDAFFLEFDTERAGGFDPLRFMPKGKKVILGAVSTKTPVLESKDELRRKIEAAATFVPLENLSLTPPFCFASRPRASRPPF